MTPVHIAEIGATSLLAGATTAVAMIETQADGWFVVLVPMAVSALVGYFTARITSEREMGVITEREGNHFLEIMRRLDKIDRKLDGE